MTWKERGYAVLGGLVVGLGVLGLAWEYLLRDLDSWMDRAAIAWREAY